MPFPHVQWCSIGDKVLQLLHACGADMVNDVQETINESASSEKLVSSLISVLPEIAPGPGQDGDASRLAAAVWALFQRACKCGLALSTSAQHKLWLWQTGDCKC